MLFEKNGLVDLNNRDVKQNLFYARCIQLSMICKGKTQCADISDEEGCNFDGKEDHTDNSVENDGEKDEDNERLNSYQMMRLLQKEKLRI